MNLRAICKFPYIRATMRMKDSTKYTIFIVLGFIGLWTCWQLNPDRKDELEIDGIAVSKKPCYYAIRELYGGAIDSVKACDCMIPGFYNVIKEDSALVQLFIEYRTTFIVEGPLGIPAQEAINNCIRSNIIDTTIKMNLPPESQLKFKVKLAEQLKTWPDADKIDLQMTSNCVVDKLVNDLTIAEYFSEDYSKEPKIRSMIFNCIERSQVSK